MKHPTEREEGAIELRLPPFTQGLLSVEELVSLFRSPIVWGASIPRQILRTFPSPYFLRFGVYRASLSTMALGMSLLAHTCRNYNPYRKEMQKD